MTDRHFIILAVVIYAGAFLYSLYMLYGRVRWESWVHRLLVAAGFLAHTYGLYLRANSIDRCPLTNLFETIMFITWAIVLVYLVVGLVWRVSLLGEFTLPMVGALCIFGLFPAWDQPRANLTHNTWLSLHAAFSLLGYGALGLAAVTGLMYLLQERQIKQHHLHSLFLRLPAIRELDIINYRLLTVGFILLTLGILFGFVLGVELMQQDRPKTIWSFAVWAVYAGLLWARMTYRLRGRKIAIGSIATMVFLLATFWSVNMLSGLHRF